MSGKAPTHHGRQRVEPWRPPALLRVALLSAGHVRFHDRQRLADRSREIGSPRDLAGRVGTEGVDERVTDARPTKLAVQVHSALSPGRGRPDGPIREIAPTVPRDPADVRTTALSPRICGRRTRMGRLVILER